MANESDSQNQGPQGPGDLAWSAGSSLFRFSYSWSALEMMRDAQKRGYHVPWTRVNEKGEGAIAKFGMKHGAWGERGLMHVPVNPRAAKLYAKHAWGGLRDREARKIVESSLTKKLGAAAAKRAAAGVAMSVVTGNVAGVALNVAGLVLTTGFGAEIVGGAYRGLESVVGKYRGLELGGYFPETQAGYTSRQRNLQAITASNLQARSAIGNEAMLFHR
jgi:hypothetical protein